MLNANHYVALYAAYSAALVALLCVRRWVPAARLTAVAASFDRPWREFGYALLAVVGVVGVGQLYQRGLRLPTSGALGWLAESCNQILIFSPVVLLLVVRRHGPATAWMPADRVGAHLTIGVVLAAMSTIVFTSLRSDSDAWNVVLPRLVAVGNVEYAVQIFLEDVSIAVLLVRLGAAIGRPAVAALTVAFLFAAGHIPAMLTDSASASETVRLVVDFGLGAAVLLVVQRSGSIWWFFCVHFAMDMMQFGHVVGPAAGA